MAHLVEPLSKHVSSVAAIDMPAASPIWSSDLQQQVMATTNEDLQCLLRVANTPEERWRIIELLIVLGARTAVQMLDSNAVACTRASPASLQQGRSPNSCAECSFEDVEALLEEAVMCPDTASPGYSQANEEIDALTEYDFKPDSKSREAHQTSVGCVGKSLTSSLRVIRGRKSRRNRHAVEASPTTGSSSHNSTPAHCQPEQDATLASVDVKMSGFGFDNRFGQVDSHMPQRCGGRRALDYGRQHRSSSGRDAQAQRTPQPAPQSGHSGVHDVRQRHDSMPASARSAERCGSVWQGTPGHTLPATDSRRLSGPGAREMRLDNGSLHARGRLTTLNEVERLEFASEPSTQPEVLFADTARSSEAQLPARGDDELCPGDPHSLDMARHALLRSTASGRANLAEAQAALQAGQPRRRLMSLLSISKQSTQRNLIPSSRSDQRCSATESEISGALHGLGNVLMSTSASVLQNPGELDHMDAFSKVDSTELVTMRGAPSHLVASCPVDSA